MSFVLCSYSSFLLRQIAIFLDVSIVVSFFSLVALSVTHPLLYFFVAK